MINNKVYQERESERYGRIVGEGEYQLSKQGERAVEEEKVGKGNKAKGEVREHKILFKAK